MILNLHRSITNNVGDLRCAPALYFESLKDCERLDLLGFRQSEVPLTADRQRWLDSVSSADQIIVGGGGLVGIDFFKPGLEKLFQIKKPNCETVLWGAGHNAWALTDWRKLKFEIDASSIPFDRVGIRDYNQGFEWVPCASCLSPLFDMFCEISPTREVGLYVHKGTMLNKSFSARLPDKIELLSNDADFDHVIAYLASCELVLTDSYHGAYWATLLGKKVVAFPSSSKFYSLKHPVPLCVPEDWERFALLSVRHQDALEECRASNLKFAASIGVS